MSNQQVKFSYADTEQIANSSSKDFLSQFSTLWVELYVTINKEILDQLPSLKHIFTSTTGTGHIDLGVCKLRGIEIHSLNEYREITEKITSTSELTWLLVLSVWRKLFLNIQTESVTVSDIAEIRERNKGLQISGRSLGVIGFGRVGRRVCEYGKAFGMQIGYYDNETKSLENSELSYRQFESLEELLNSSDVIVISASSTTDSTKIISQNNIDFVKQGAILINTARGKLWDESLVLSYLEKGRISGVGVDVYEFEENAELEHSPFLECENSSLNLVRTPHIGGATIDAQEIVTKELGAKIIELLLKK